MPRRNPNPKPELNAWKPFLGIFLSGIILSLIASCAVLLLSEDSGTPLPKPADDLSTLDLLYLRAYLRLHYDDLRSPSAPADGVFDVVEGETAAEICVRLEQQAWVHSADLVCNYLRYTGGDRRIGSGSFLIRAGQSPQQIADSLASAESKIRLFTLFAGWRLEETAEALPQSGIPMLPAEFLAAASGRPNSSGSLTALYAEIPSWANLEGFLLPGQYRLVPGDAAERLVERMAVNFWQSLSPGWIEAVRSRGLSVYQAVTMASIIEREAMLEEEMALIASVLYNRLAIDMRLQVDPTVQYALGFQTDRGGWWASPLRDADLGLDSPYNTYVFSGLPPGPICSPSMAALDAIAQPVPSGFYYYRAACDGSGRHNFAETYIQHLANACGG
ncbi:MAG: endolytic transglycosylase MltG [Anaerolineales bacterium]|nr:endolytic transglycosylase MltG [Anaerolineales bacterium]